MDWKIVIGRAVFVTARKKTFSKPFRERAAKVKIACVRQYSATEITVRCDWVDESVCMCFATHRVQPRGRFIPFSSPGVVGVCVCVS